MTGSVLCPGGTVVDVLGGPTRRGDALAEGNPISNRWQRTGRVRLMTSTAANRFHLADRGRIVEGALVDLEVFDPATVSAKPTYERPRQAATGILHVLVNGEFALEIGNINGKCAERVLRLGD